MQLTELTTNERSYLRSQQYRALFQSLQASHSKGGSKLLLVCNNAAAVRSP